jgi:HSP20 family protein
MTNLVRWDPFSDMDRTFNRMMRRAFTGWPRQALEGDGGHEAQWSPSADISETDKEYLIRAELPAVKKEDVKVTVDAGIITIEGERKQQKEDKSEKRHLVESFYGSFTRSFSLPDDVNVDGIRCEGKDGVLTVHLPKSETPKAKQKQISIQLISLPRRSASAFMEDACALRTHRHPAAGVCVPPICNSDAAAVVRLFSPDTVTDGPCP